MEMQDGILHVGSFLAATLGIIVLFAGKRLIDSIGVLREFSIPEPVVGGLLFSILIGLVYAMSGVEVEFDLPGAVGMLGGTVSLIGGHGTAIAWAPDIAAHYNVPQAMEIGIACATFGLILASLMGGPIAKFLIKRHNLAPETQELQDVGFSDVQEKVAIGQLDFLGAVLAIHVSIVVGIFLNLRNF